MTDELQKLIDSKTVVTADGTGNFYYMLHKYDVVELIAKLLTHDVNAELLEALNDLYQSLPDGYTDECLVKVKKQLLPYWNERSKLLSQQLEDEEF